MRTTVRFRNVWGFATVAMVAFALQVCAESIVLYEFGDVELADPTFEAANTTSSAMTGDGWGGHGRSGSGNYFGRGISTSPVTSYVSFTITATAGTLNLTQLDFDYYFERSDGVTADLVTFEVRSDVDGFASAISGTYSLNPAGVTPPYQNATLDLSGGSYDGLSSIEFRLYATNDTETHINDIVRWDNILVTGSVAGGVPVPDMQVLQGGSAIAVGASDDLGSVDPGGTLSRDYAVTNDAAAGAALLLTNTPAVVFSDNGQTSYNGFTITANISGGSTNLAPGETASFTIQFSTNATVVGSSATVSIPNNDTTVNPYTFDVTASAIPAGLIAYDGFEAGGATPGAGQYETGTGYADDAIVAGGGTPAQGPDTVGFSSSDNWGGSFYGGPGFASTVYYQASETNLVYADNKGNVLDTSDGSVRHLHEFTPDNKTIGRTIDNQPASPAVAYYSFLVRLESEDSNWTSSLELGVNQSAGNRYTSVRVTTNGQLQAYAFLGSSTNTGSTLAANQDYFVVVRLEELAGTPDSMHVWLNPPLAAEPALGTADASITADLIYVGNNAAFPLDQLGLTAYLDNSSADDPEDFVYFDEFRLGETWSAVTPHAALPPSGMVIVIK